MKKAILPILAVTAILASCGQSAEEKAQREKQLKDSIDYVQKEATRQMEERLKRTQDSITEAAKLMNEQLEQKVDAATEKMKNDADANKKEIDRLKKEKKKKEDAVKPENVKAGQGKG